MGRDVRQQGESLYDMEIFYDGKARPIPEAGGLLFRHMIEQDLLNSPHFQTGEDSYRYIASCLNKHERSIRNWVCNWDAPGGARPTLIDFLLLVHITKSKRPIKLLKDLISDATPEQLKKNHDTTMLNIAEHIRGIADTIENYVKNEE